MVTKSGCGKRDQTYLEVVSKRKVFHAIIWVRQGWVRECYRKRGKQGHPRVRMEMKAEEFWQDRPHPHPLGEEGKMSCWSNSPPVEPTYSDVNMEVQEANWDNRNHSRYFRQREFNAGNWWHGNRIEVT